MDYNLFRHRLHLNDDVIIILFLSARNDHTYRT